MVSKDDQELEMELPCGDRVKIEPDPNEHRVLEVWLDDHPEVGWFPVARVQIDSLRPLADLFARAAEIWKAEDDDES